MYLAGDLVGSLALWAQCFQVSEEREVNNGKADVSHDGGQTAPIQAGETFRVETKGSVMLLRDSYKSEAGKGDLAKIIKRKVKDA